MKHRVAGRLLGSLLSLAVSQVISAAILFTPGTLYLTSGNGSPNYSGDSGSAANATLNWPYSVAVNPVDSSILIADTQNNCIRRIDTTGRITTIAGRGPETAGYAGDGGLATQAALNAPLGVIADVQGNIYIADSGNFVIRRIDPTGVITTYAGGGNALGSDGLGDDGPATSAQFGLPFAVATDADGNVYVSDRANNEIRCVQKNSGIITVVAGGGTGTTPATQATLAFPGGIALFGNNLYIADTANQVIKKIDLSSGSIDIVAGGGTTPVGEAEGGPAVSARLAVPSAVAIDSNGILYFSDASDALIRRVDASGIIRTVAGQYGSLYPLSQKASTFASSLSAPFGIAVMADGSLLVADTGNSAIRQLRPDQAWLPFAADGQLSITVLNASTVVASVNLSSLSGTNATDFYVVEDACSGSPLAAEAECIITMGYSASSSSSEAANASLTVPGGTQSIMLTGGSSAGVSPLQALEFVPMTPCRVVDTRGPNGPLGGPSITAQGTRSFPILNGQCSVPAYAAAYSLNLTVVPHGSLGYITMWPTGSQQPYVSTINSVDGRTKAVATIVPAGVGGAVSVYAYNATDLTLDINGYFVPKGSSEGLAFYPVTPCRAADTRNPAGPLGGPALGGGETRNLPLLSATCSLPANAKAYSLNFTAVPSAPLPYLTVWPAGDSQPYTSVLNDFVGRTVANANLAPAGVSGDISVFSYAPSNLVVDVNGYFAPSDGKGFSYYNVTPCRIVDTRDNGGSPITTLIADVAGSSCNVPIAAAYAVNLTVVPIGPLGYVTLWPWQQPQPYVSTLNASDGIVASNLAIVPANMGKISAFASNPTHLIIDVLGFFE